VKERTVSVWKIVPWLVAACVLVLLAGCSGTETASPAGGTLRVAINPGFVPFEQIENGQLTGFDVDLANALANKLGKKAVFDQMPFTSLLAAVKSGRADIAISGILDTPERRKEVTFSTPYVFDSFVMTVSSSNQSVTKLSDLAQSKIAVQVGTVPEEFVKEKLPSATLVTVQDTPSAFQLVAQGRADAVVTDAPVAGYYVKKVGGLKLLPTPLNTAQPVAAVLPPNSALLPQVNDALTALDADGTLNTMRQKWFGDTVSQSGT
jgi:polar amino acid transport system substrate-binding protein